MKIAVIGAGCNEKFDCEFMKWILHKGRTKAIKKSYKQVATTYPQKLIVLKNRRQVSRFLTALHKGREGVTQ